MTLGQYLRLVLTQAPGIAALAEDRVYSEVLPDEAPMPALVFDQVSVDQDEVLGGTSGTSRASISIDCWAKTRAEATALGLAVKGFLQDHSGGAGGLEVQAVFFVTQSWDFDEETQQYVTSQDFEVWYSGAEE